MKTKIHKIELTEHEIIAVLNSLTLSIDVRKANGVSNNATLKKVYERLKKDLWKKEEK